jgi:D-alanyl-lipoteichoic acid acyltransferase DltB (MBOAT superfamily)
MIFNSLEFLIFFPVVCLLYFPLPQALKKPWLLVCSYYFYMCWHAGFAALIFISTLSTWLCGFLIERAAPRWRKLALVLNLALNLGILFTFKYFDFFSGSVAALFGAKPLLFSLTLPVGISFYTFQALGYSIDVYRGDIPHEKSFLNYALFVSFFPQLVAGPIERSANFLPQLHERKYFDEYRIGSGFTRMLVGFFKKVVVADGLAAFVDVVYAATEKFSALQLMAATVMFAVQIYCDFGGYSDIAVGAAQVLGFRLMQNFDRPYFASSISDFWRRWHVSLSGWFRDYF